MVADLTEQLKILEARSNQLLHDYDKVQQEKEGLQGKIRDHIQKVQKAKEEVEERDERIN